ncbi:MAG: DEAD/DEAH box helicase, partial [Gammaproteobacteria bacterium]
MRNAEPLTALHGVGPRLAERLEGLGIHRPEDLLFHLPLRYEDRTRIQPIGGLVPGEPAQVEGEVEHSAIVRGRRPMLVVLLADGTGRISLRFFHFRAHQKNQLGRGARLRCFGDVRAGYQGLEMVHPSYTRVTAGREPPLEDRLTPVYPTADGLARNTWLKLSEQALQRLRDGAFELRELLPPAMLANLRLPSLTEALETIHRPPPGTDVAALMERRHPAQHRLALEELLAHNLSMRLLHQRQRAQKAPLLEGPNGLEKRFVERLPFDLTGAQRRVVEELRRDLGRDHPMLRLVHGDVGSGKTVVAALAALRATGADHQVAVVAPTELLAEQHLRVFGGWLAPLGLEPVWLSSKVTGKARERALAAIAGGAPLVIGTHALMQE